ncbi:MAG: hypothetical protein CMM58_11495 [Rhodospirillaceae bacterium]|nr:hypothetical protein [Rhodospirillaceae bacterium]
MLRILKHVSISIFIFAFFVLNVMDARGSSNQVFVVENIAVDVTADTALAARREALENGQIIAWKRLLNRITLPKQSVHLSRFSFEQIRPLIRGYEVLRERMSPVRYLADLSVTFNTEQVRKNLFDYGVPFVETPSLPVLILPIFETEGVPVLWENPNPWRDVWQNLPEQDSLLPIIVPKGGLADIRDLSASQALRGETDFFKPILKRYRAKKVVIAKASRKFDVADSSPLLEISIANYNAEGRKEILVDSIRTSVESEMLGLLDTGVIRIVNVLINSWKAENLVTSAVQQRISAIVPIHKFEKWLSIRSRLEIIGILKKIELLRLSKKEALLDLWIMGSVKQFKNALSQKQLELYDGGDEFVVCEHDVKTPSICGHSLK